MVLISYSMDTLTDWHRRFIELFEALYETGYTTDYAYVLPPMVRYLPVEKAIEAHPMALPSDKLEIVFDQFDTFGNRQLPVPHDHGSPRPGMRQTAGQLSGYGHMGRDWHRKRLS